jgi:AbrB family looped-hinge helix DNA binding protein
MSTLTPKLKINPKFYEKDVMYGMTTMGPRGQIVIPAEARKDLGIETGDRLLVVGKFGKVLSMMKAEDIEGMVSMMMDHVVKNVDDEPFKKHVKKQVEELRKYIK